MRGVKWTCQIHYLFFFFFFFFGLFRVAPMAHGNSQARGQIRAIATGLCQSHSKAGFNHLEVSSFIGLLVDAGY